MSSSDKKNSIKIDLEEGVELCISVKASHECNRHTNKKEMGNPLWSSYMTVTPMDSDHDLAGTVINQSYRLQMHCIADNGHVIPLHQGWDHIDFRMADAPVDLIKLGVNGGPINDPALDGVLYGVITPRGLGTSVFAAVITIGIQTLGYVRRDVKVNSSK